MATQRRIGLAALACALIATGAAKAVTADNDLPQRPQTRSPADSGDRPDDRPRPSFYDPRETMSVELTPAGILVADLGSRVEPGQGGAYVIRRDGSIVWSFTRRVTQPNAARAVGERAVVLSDTGNDRVLIIGRDGRPAWSSDRVRLSDGSSLRGPTDARLVRADREADEARRAASVLITDRGNNRVIEVGLDGEVRWQFGTPTNTDAGRRPPLILSSPQNAVRLGNGNTLIADTGNRRVVEVTREGTVAWQFEDGLRAPRDARRLDNGHTLITDTASRRVLEVSPRGRVVWRFDTPGVPTEALGLDSGATLISMTGGLIAVDPDGIIVWQYLRQPCRADFNGDGVVDSADVEAFMRAYRAGDRRADLNGDGVVDVLDLVVFLDLHASGCP